MSLVRTFRKTPLERRRLYLDYQCWLEGNEVLSDFQVVVDPLTVDAPVTLDLAYTDAARKKLTMYVAGGVGNVDYVLKLLVRTDLGQIKRDDIGLRLLPS
jgi:hypothetical protein